MRFMLQENMQDKISLVREIDYLNNYIDLQKLRTDTNPIVKIDAAIEQPLNGVTISPMLLIPFVENAFKHGISLKKKSWIKIELGYKDNLVRFEVRNSIHRNENNPDYGKSGIGLVNVKERLKLQYPDKYVLDIAETENEFSVKLILQC